MASAADFIKRLNLASTKPTSSAARKSGDGAFLNIAQQAMHEIVDTPAPAHDLILDYATGHCDPDLAVKPEIGWATQQ
jgi:hypothetical protein